MIHWFQSIEGLLLLALDGRSLSGLPNCAIFRKTLTTVPTNDFLTNILVLSVFNCCHPSLLTLAVVNYNVLVTKGGLKYCL
jgi:hypothetical protein